MARTNRILAQAVLQILLPARGYTDIRFTADDKLTAIMPDGTEMAAVVTSRIIGEHTRESDVISIAPRNTPPTTATSPLARRPTPPNGSCSSWTSMRT